MANVKTTPKEWDKAREYYEAGLLLREVSDKTGISIPSISKKAKAENWSKENQKKTLVQDAVRVEAAKANLSDTALKVHNEIVGDRVKCIDFFDSAAITNVREAMAIPCESQNDYKARAETISKGRGDVLGKAPETQVNVQNNIQQPAERPKLTRAEWMELNGIE